MKPVDLEAMAKLIHENAVDKGFWKPNTPDNHIVFYLKQLAMIHSEVTEVLEAIRKEQGGHKIVEEFADIIIRILDLYYGMKVDGSLWSYSGVPSLQAAIEEKIDINRGRPEMHGVLA